MNKKFFAVLFLIILAVIISFSGCEPNSAKIFLGNSENKGTQLVQGKSVVIVQTKESIKNSQLVFSKNNDGEYENLYFNFEGKGLKSVDVTSSNRSVLYEHTPDKYAYCIDVFPIAIYVDLDDFGTMYGTNMKDFVFNQNWDNGKYDDVKNVYFNGMSSEDIEDYNDGLDADGVFISGFGDGNFETNISNYSENNSCTIEPFERYIVVDSLCENVYFDTGVMIHNVAKTTDKKIINGKYNIYNPGNTASSAEGDGTQSFLYRYELLFYKSQQNALKSKGSFDYSDLQGETIDIKITYTDNSTESYSVEITFNGSGNIMAALR